MSEETAVAVREPVAPMLPGAPDLTDDEINRMFRVANALARSNMFKSVTQAEQAFAKLLMGRDLGLTPIQSMQSIYVFEGNVSVHYSMILNFIRARPGYDYEISNHTNESCTFVVTIDGVPAAAPETFTIADAELAGLLGKDAWKKYPKNMLLARVIANYVRWHVPEVCAGLPVYVPDEVDQLGRTVDGSAEPARLGDPAVVESEAIWGYVSDRIGSAETERMKAVIARAGWNPAETQMKLDGQNAETLRRYLKQMEEDHPEDAEVVTPEAEPAEEGDKLDEREDAPEPPEKLDDREASLQARVDQIQMTLMTDIGPAEAADLEAELDFTLQRLAEEREKKDAPEDDGPATLL